MNIAQRLKKIERQLADQQGEGTVRVIFGNPVTKELVDTSNPNDIIVYFNIPRPTRVG